MRGRRLTLAPSVRAALRPKTVVDDHNSGDEEEALRVARSEMSKVIDLAIAAGNKLPSVHGVEVPRGKFWAASPRDDSEPEEESEDEISTSDIIAEAKLVGFSLEDLQHAEDELNTSVRAAATLGASFVPLAAVLKRKSFDLHHQSSLHILATERWPPTMDMVATASPKASPVSLPAVVLSLDVASNHTEAVSEADEADTGEDDKGLVVGFSAIKGAIKVMVITIGPMAQPTASTGTIKAPGSSRASASPVLVVLPFRVRTKVLQEVKGWLGRWEAIPWLHRIARHCPRAERRRKISMAGRLSLRDALSTLSKDLQGFLEQVDLQLAMQALLCDVCDSDEHVAKACPYSKGAKPTAILCGYAVDSLGFYHIPFNGKQKANLDSKDALVKVLEGSLTEAQVTVELERLLPGNVKWVLEKVDQNTFATTFPSEADLHRMILWGPIEAKNVKARMEISEKKDAEEWKYEIPKSWIQFRGLSKELREFPIIWAIGSILGVTQKVDMKFTKANGRPRIRVAVLNPDLIPKFIDIRMMEPEPERENSIEEEQQGNKEVNTPKGSTVSSVPNSGPKSTGVGASVAKLTTVNNQLNSRPMVSLNPTGLEGTKAWVTSTFYTKTNIAPANVTPVKTSLPEQNVTPTRKSNSALVDEDSLDKAARIKAKKKSGSTRESTSFVNDLKKLEKERLSVDASGGFNNPVISVEEVEDELDFLHLNHLCGGVVEGVSEDEASDLFDLHASPTVRISSSQRKKRKGKRRSSTSR
ncbi:hypothetical protein U9M48_004889 [Paspalum notatum var. saurae]|uniref:DUF4283 domain-containing protein n=1 Tax=Paspalum notatum var. saurae TaxID=547442 RepID=A0AAQ3PWG7_PASNO